MSSGLLYSPARQQVAAWVRETLPGDRQRGWRWPLESALSRCHGDYAFGWWGASRLERAASSRGRRRRLPCHSALLSLTDVPPVSIPIAPQHQDMALSIRESLCALSGSRTHIDWNTSAQAERRTLFLRAHARTHAHTPQKQAEEENGGHRKQLSRKF